jgi:tetratricopeptide (TPR) repeat protein
MPDVRELFDKALKFAESGQYEKALELIHKTIKLDANNPNIWYNQGIILFKMGRYLDARNSFAQAADIDPEFAEAWYNKGMALMNLGKYLEATRIFDKAIALNPNYREARQQRDLAQKKVMESVRSSTQPLSSGKQTRLFK